MATVLGPIEALRASTRVLRSHPVAVLALGVALVVSTPALFATPWFGCELFATQIGAATGARPERRGSWLWAALMLSAAVLMVAMAGWFSMLGLGADMPVLVGTPVDSPIDAPAIGFAVLGVVAGWLFLLPFSYAPLVLVDRGGGLVGASLASARMVAEGGVGRHAALSVVLHVIQASPLLVCGGLALASAGPEMLPLALLLALPLLCVTVPLGQGMLVSAYVQLRDRVDITDERTSRGIVAALVALVALMALSLVLLTSSLARPSRPRSGPAPQGEVVVEVRPSEEPRQAIVPQTALAIVHDDSVVSIEAWDGGGAGPLPLRGRPPIERIRVVRVRDAYAVELTTASGPETTWIDRVGIRLDDTLGERLTDRLPAWGGIAVVLGLLMTPLALLGTFVSLSGRRRRRAWWFILLALPGAVAAFAAGLLASFGS